jgi:hypothetical protein
MTLKIKVINNKWKNDGYKLLIYLRLRKTVGFKMFDKYIIIRHAWYAFSSFEIQLLSFFQGSLIFGESDVKMHQLCARF